MAATRSLPAVRDLLTKLALDEASLTYVLDIVKNDEDATADVNTLYEAIGPFIESSANNGAAVDGREECRKILKVWPPKAQPPAARKFELDSPVIIGKDTTPTPAAGPAAASKSDQKTEERKAPRAASPEKEKDDSGEAEMAYGEGAHSSDEDWKNDDIEEMVFASTGSRGRTTVNNSNDIRISNIFPFFFMLSAYRSSHLSARNVDLLVAATLNLYYGRRYGLVGRNGVGKSTLMDRISRRLITDFPPHIRVLLVKQEINGDDRSVLDTVIESDEERTALLKELAEIQKNSSKDLDGSRQSAISDRLREIDAFSAEARAKQLLHQLGFTDEQLSQPTKELSGGWKKRTALAGAAFVAKSIHLLLLDEPTTHLDLHTILWVQRFLRSYTGTALIVSHDGSFLDNVCTDIAHFHRKQLFYFPCGFSDFLTVLDDKRKKRLHLQENLDKAKDKIKQSVQKMAKQAQGNKVDQKRFNQIASRKKKLERMGFEKTEDGKKWNCQTHGIRAGSQNANEGGWKNGKRTAGSQVDVGDPALKFSFPVAEPLGTHGAIVTLNDVSFAYPGSPMLFAGVSMSITSESRIGILGCNGSGKSTLLQVITRALEPTKGEVSVQRNAVLGYFSQHHVDQLDLSATPLEHLSKLHPLAKEKEVRGQLAAYGVTAELATRKMSQLSGGQRTRVVFAIITWHHPHVLLLDEPTNHLDFETVGSVQDAVATFEGAVIVVSHHQSFIDALGLDLFMMTKKRLTPYEGTFAEYLQTLASEDDAAK